MDEYLKKKKKVVNVTGPHMNRKPDPAHVETCNASTDRLQSNEFILDADALQYSADDVNFRG
jgi:hypothetical protein